MSAKRAQEVYNDYIRPLPINERLRLLAILAEDVAHQSAEELPSEMHNIMELHGLGRKCWGEIDK